MAGSCFENEEHQIPKTGTNVETLRKKEKRLTQRNFEKQNRERKEKAGIHFIG
jgi:hypothetical protein